MKLRTVKDVLRYCEDRAGTKLVDGFYVPTGRGGGLHALEQLAAADGAFPRHFYERQRIELQLLMSNLYKALGEK